MSFRLVATDLDGTLYRSDGTISRRTRAALDRLVGIGVTLIVVTGRPPRWLDRVAEETGHNGLAICANGAYLYDLSTERVLREQLLPAAVAARCVRLLSADLPGVSFAAEDAAGFAHEGSYRPRWSAVGARVVESADALCYTPVAKLLVRHEELGPDVLLRAAREAVGELVTLTHSSHDGLLEISASGVTKASALAELCSELAIEAADVLAIGDMPNDLPMLEWAGRSVAVANAHPDVLATVDEVTFSNDDDGVASVLERKLFA